MPLQAKQFSTVMALVYARALADARLFFEEFGEPIDPKTTDWDADAWENAAAMIRNEAEIDPDQLDLLWPIYQGMLVFFTTCLHDLATSKESSDGHDD